MQRDVAEPSGKQAAAVRVPSAALPRERQPVLELLESSRRTPVAHGPFEVDLTAARSGLRHLSDALTWT
jgi:hypothetical protein